MSSQAPNSLPSIVAIVPAIAASPCTPPLPLPLPSGANPSLINNVQIEICEIFRRRPVCRECRRLTTVTVGNPIFFTFLRRVNFPVKEDHADVPIESSGGILRSRNVSRVVNEHLVFLALSHCIRRIRCNRTCGFALRSSKVADHYRSRFANGCLSFYPIAFYSFDGDHRMPIAVAYSRCLFKQFSAAMFYVTCLRSLAACKRANARTRERTGAFYLLNLRGSARSSMKYRTVDPHRP